MEKEKRYTEKEALKEAARMEKHLPRGWKAGKYDVEDYKRAERQVEKEKDLKIIIDAWKHFSHGSGYPSKIFAKYNWKEENIIEILNKIMQANAPSPHGVGNIRRNLFFGGRIGPVLFLENGKAAAILIQETPLLGGRRWEEAVYFFKSSEDGDEINGRAIYCDDNIGHERTYLSHKTGYQKPSGHYRFSLETIKNDEAGEEEIVVMQKLADGEQRMRDTFNKSAEAFYGL